MPIAVVTGGSRGFGRAITAALAAEGWAVVVDARSAAALDAAVAGLPGTVRAIGGRRRRRRPPQDLVDAAAELGGLDLLVNNASTLGPSPLPGLADLPARRARRGLPHQRRRPARPRAAGAAPARGRRRRRGRHHLGRRGRGLRGVGRLRVVEGGARPADATCSPPSTRGCASAASTPATCGRRCTRTPSRARTSPTGPEPEAVVPALLRLLATARRAAATELLTWPATRWIRPATRFGMTAALRPAAPPARLALRPPGRARGRRARPRPGASRATPCACWSPAGATAGSVHTHLRPPPALPRGRRPRGRQHLGHDPRRVDADAADGTAVVVHLSTQLDDGRWVRRAAPPHRAGEHPVDGTPAGAATRTLADGGRLAARRAYRGSGRLWVGPPRAPPPGARRGWPPTAVRSATATSTGRGRSPPTRTCTPPSRAAPRCRAPAGRSPPR